LHPCQDGISQDRTTGEAAEAGLVALRITPRAHKRTIAPTLEGKYFKFKLNISVEQFFVEPAREPFVLMHMRKPWETRAVVPVPTTAVDEPSTTPTDALPTPPPAAGSEIHPVINKLHHPERPESPEEVTGLIERLSLAGASSSSDGGEGGSVAASDRSAAASAEGGTKLARGARCEITGLVAAAKHNSKRCTLTEFQEASGRWKVNPKTKILNFTP